MRTVPALLTLCLGALGWGATGSAQVPVRDTTVARDTVSRDTTVKDTVAADTIQRDTLARDTSVRDTSTLKPLVQWVETDSVINALIARPGYRATRYQGKRVVFDAQSRSLRIDGNPAAVGRDQTLVVGDTVIYNDSTRIVIALGDTVVLRDPTQQSADVVARGRVAYDVARRRGLVTNVSTSVESGETYFIGGRTAAFVADTSPAKRTAFYISQGMITSCDDSIPDYFIKGKELKYISKNLIAVRPATLYIAGVPVFWLPFFFQDVRPGRRSGMLRPRFGVSEIVRNNPSYRRQIENFGYYFNMGNYMDAQVSLDWRSGARSTEGDPGFTRINGEFRYNWLDRFMTGGIATSREMRRDGGRNTSVSWNHSQQFSQTSRLTANVNFVTNTTVQRQNNFDPRLVLATIRSDVRYNRKIGSFSVDVGGNRTQYPGRSQVDEDYPNISISSPTLAVTNWLDWTPTASFTRRVSRHTDAVQSIAYRYFTNANGLPDSTRIDGSSGNMSFRLNTPFSIRGYQITASVSGSSQESNFPVTRTFIDPADTSQRINRTYSRSYLDGLDWSVGFSLPTFFSNTFRVSPSLSFDNVMGGNYWVRSELSRGRFVSQGKRLSGGVSVSPTFFGLFPGFGPFSRIRHSITPSLQYRYAPRGRVSQAYLEALNQSGRDFIGNLAQQQLTLNLSQVFEAKYRSDTSANGEGRKIKLLAINFSPFTYDFERRRKTGRSGFATDRFSYDLSSDLLPGFTFRSSYSLFQGSLLSDTAEFKPFREEISASFNLSSQQGLGAVLSRLFGRPSQAKSVQTGEGEIDTLAGQALSSLPVTGSAVRERQFAVNQVQGWTTSLSFSSRRQRPPRGGRILTYDPATYCNQFIGNPVIFDQCRESVLLNPQTSLPSTDPIAGGVFVRTPPTETLQAQSNFRITEKWSANWSTMYDLVNNRFASQQVTLQRELHDWRAVFSFTSSPNGNFYFSVTIANKAQPQLQFPYQRSTYRQPDIR
jgi:hypothetical protein